MPRPKGSKNRINVVPAPDAAMILLKVAAENPPKHEPELVARPMPHYKLDAPMTFPILTDEELAPAEPEPPSFWGRGALLNVRCTGGDYIVTLYPEEYDARSPERAMRFANPALCQNFVSAWYSRQSHDPRAW